MSTMDNYELQLHGLYKDDIEYLYTADIKDGAVSYDEMADTFRIKVRNEWYYIDNIPSHTREAALWRLLEAIKSEGKIQNSEPMTSRLNGVVINYNIVINDVHGKSINILDFKVVEPREVKSVNKEDYQKIADFGVF